jgi:hypothetical protein
MILPTIVVVCVVVGVVVVLAVGIGCCLYRRVKQKRQDAERKWFCMIVNEENAYCQVGSTEEIYI